MTHLPESARAALAKMHTNNWISPADLGEKLKRTTSWTRRSLIALHDAGLVERRVVASGPGVPPRHEYRRLARGEKAPLFEGSPGLDIKPLAECFGMYTYATF